MVKAPARGDVVLVDLRPGFGVEQGGEPRPCVVISSTGFNALSPLLVLCPMTKRRKGRAFEVDATFRGVDGAILVDQIRSIDRRARKVPIIGSIDALTLERVLAKINALLFQ